MSASRDDDLMGRLLDDELNAAELDELVQLAREEPSRGEVLRLQLEAAELLSMAVDELRGGDRFTGALRSRLEGDGFVERVRKELDRETAGPPRQRVGGARWLPWGLAAASVLALVASLAAMRPWAAGATVCRIRQVSGAVQWIGDGGRVRRELGVGTELGGGTIEALTADSWASLEFGDGSAVTISGPSMVTVSELGRKELYVRQGSVFARVAPQGSGRPMVIRTRLAEMQVLGTRLNLEAEAAATRLSVNEGRVRVVRLVDGRAVEVGSNEQVVATTDRSAALEPEPRPSPVDRWSSQLTCSLGQVMPAGEGIPPRLRALPILLNRPRGAPLALYLAGFGVEQCGSPPVRLGAGARFRVRGRLSSLADVHFGITTKRPEGGFGGKFEAVVAANELGLEGGAFEVEVGLDEMEAKSPRPPGSPVGADLVDCYVCTVNVDAGLEVAEVELLPGPPRWATRGATSERGGWR
jgi:hypothetical protein